MRLIALFSLLAVAGALSHNELYSAFCRVAIEHAKSATTAAAFAKAVYPAAKDLCESTGIKLNNDRFEAYVLENQLRIRSDTTTYESCMNDKPSWDKVHEGCEMMSA